MSDIPTLPYSLLWGERSIGSVANLTRADGVDFMRVAARMAAFMPGASPPLVRTAIRFRAMDDGNL